MSETQGNSGIVVNTDVGQDLVGAKALMSMAIVKVYRVNAKLSKDRANSTFGKVSAAMSRDDRELLVSWIPPNLVGTGSLPHELTAQLAQSTGQLAVVHSWRHFRVQSTRLEPRPRLGRGTVPFPKELEASHLCCAWPQAAPWQLQG